MRPYGYRLHASALVTERRGRGPLGRALVLVPIAASARARQAARREIGRCEDESREAYRREASQVWDEKHENAAFALGAPGWRDGPRVAVSLAGPIRALLNQPARTA